MDPPLDDSQAGTGSVWQLNKSLEERGCGGVPQLHQAHPRDVPRRGGATQAEATEERRLVHRLAGGWTEGGHHTHAPVHGGTATRR